MTSLSCPSCGSAVLVPDRVEAGQPVPCPRCGQSFPCPPLVGQAEDRLTSRPPARTEDGIVAQLPYAAAGTPPSTPRRFSNRSVALAILGLMGAMAVAGLLWALLTQPGRRARDPVNLLGYLPGDCNAVAAVDLTKTLKEPAGRDFVDQVRLGPTGLGLANIEQWTGLKREDIHQVVMGLKIDDGMKLPRLTLVVQTREPYDADAVLEALKASRPSERRKKTLHRFPVAGTSREASVWCAAENVLVVCLEPEDFDGVPLTPHAGADHLPAPIQGLVWDKLGQGSQAWVAAHAKHWETTPVWLSVTFNFNPSMEDHRVLKQVQTVGVWLRFDRGVRVNAACGCGSADGAESLRKYLVEKQIVEGEHVRVQKGDWVIVESPSSPEAVRRFMGKALTNPLLLR